MPDDAATTTQDPPAAEPEEDKERTPTEYVVLIWHDEQEVFEPLMAEPTVGGKPSLRTFEGFRRQQVLDDLIDEELITEDGDGVTPYLIITPARGARPVRGTVQTRRDISLED